MSRPYQESLPSNALARFDKYGLPGLVILILFAINAGLGYYYINTLVPVVVNNTEAMTGMKTAINELRAELKERR